MLEVPYDLKTITVIVHPHEFICPTAYSYLKDYMGYHRALMIYCTALEYYLFVGDEYLHELDSLVYDELAFLNTEDRQVDLIGAIFNILIRRGARKIDLNLYHYLYQCGGVIQHIELRSPYRLLIRIDLWQRSTLDVSPAHVNAIIKRRIQELLNEKDTIYHRNLACFITGLPKSN